MTNTITVEQIDELAIQLPLREQVRILARLAQRLSEDLTSELDRETREREAHARRVQAFLQMSDEFAADSIGAVDAAADIRQLRNERL